MPIATRPPDSLITVAGEVRGDRVAVSVADAGPGVPAAEREAVFDRYVRFDTGGRAGLGLTIAKTFVEAHGEHIWVEDVPGGGARFVFTLPVAASRRQRAVATMAKVLVIDDDPSLLRALRLGLQAGGHEVVTAVNGEQGISQTALTSPDVVVLDLGLPDIDGQAVCRRIRQWSEVPIIILSASGTEDRKVAALDGGADDYVTKPFGMAELEARIRTAIRHRSARGRPRRQPATITVGSLDLDLVHHEAQPGRRLGRPHGQGVRRAVLPGPPRREDLHPPDDPRRGVGHRLRTGGAVPARLRAPVAPEARRPARAP